MFDIGFSELLLFGVIALIVLGPEKLPQAARTAGQWYAKIRRTVSTLQSEIEAELDLAETRQQMKEELAKIRQTEAEMKREMAEIRGSMQEFEYSQNQSLDAINRPAHHQKQDSSQPDLREEAETAASASTEANTPSAFAYHYEQDDEEVLQELSGTYIDEDFDDEHFYDDNEHLLDTSVTPKNVAPPIITRPWENMWFRLSAYDQARRLPSPPYLPNYKADILLYDHFSHPDLDAKMDPIDEMEDDQAELEQSESYFLNKTVADNADDADQDTSMASSSFIKQEPK